MPDLNTPDPLLSRTKSSGVLVLVFFLLQDQFAIPDFLLSRMKSFESWQSGISSCDC
ncbi:hypothetical protein P167DRAFT_532790, partial [Morchella conica CCBAS932]